MSDYLTKLLSTFFYIGYIPVAPGSMASIAGVFLSLILHDSLYFYVMTFFIITIIGFLVSDKMEALSQEKDPSCIVIDEVSGVMIAFFMLPLTPSVILSAFFLFRAFDMFKIYPVNKFEDIKGGAGVMMDDIVAGIYTNITMHLAIRFAGLI